MEWNMDAWMDIVWEVFDMNLLKEGFSDSLIDSVLREEEMVGQRIAIHASSSKLVHALLCSYGTSQVAPSPETLTWKGEA